MSEVRLLERERLEAASCGRMSSFRTFLLSLFLGEGFMLVGRPLLGSGN